MRRRHLPLALTLLCLGLSTIAPAVGAGAAAGATGPAVGAGSEWNQFGGGPDHSGADEDERLIAPANVSQLQPYWHAELPAAGDGAPAIADAVVLPGGEVRDLAFVTTKPGGLVAIDVGSGTILWRFDPAPPCVVLSPQEACYTNSSPAVDPDKRHVYGAGSDGFVRKFDIATGAQVIDATWPEQVTLKPWVEKTSSALTIATVQGVPRLYVTNGGYTADAGNYQGHLTTINLLDGTQHVFNTLCSDKTIHLDATACSWAQSGVWARSGVVYDPATDRIYLATGNGSFDPVQHTWGDTVIALHPDGTGALGDPVDTYTPADYAFLDQHDEDLGSTAPAIVTAPPGSAVANLGVQGGKDARLRLLNMDDLSGAHGPGHLGGELDMVDLPPGTQVLSAPVVHTDPATSIPWIFVTAGGVTTAFTISLDASSRPRLSQQWTSPTPGSTPLWADGVLYVAGGSSVRALDAATGAELWSRPISTSSFGIHWQSPVLAAHVLLVEDDAGSVQAFRLGPPTNANVPTAVMATAGNFAADVTWDAPSGGSPVTAYTVTATPSGRTCTWTTGPRTCSVTGLQGGTTYRFQVTAVTADGPSPPSDPSDPVTIGWGYSFHGVAPTRVLDSRTDVGWGIAPLSAGFPRTLTIAGTHGIPSTAKAIVVNLTVTDGTAGSYLTVYPSGTNRPATSNINFAPHQTTANLVTMKLGHDGGLSLADAIGSVDVVADVAGYYDDTVGDGYTAVAPSRAVDSRTLTGGWGGAPGGPLAHGTPRTVTLAGSAAVPATATSLVANVTVTGSTANSFVSIWPGGDPQPASSSINFARGETVANLVTVPLRSGSWSLATAVGSVDVIIDVVGYYEAGAGDRFTAIEPTRILDDRVDVGVAGPWVGPQTRAVALPLAAQLPGTAQAVIVNITATNGTLGSYLSVFAPQDGLGRSSTVNFGAGQTVANLAVPRLGPGPTIAVYDLTGRVDVVGDLVGFFSAAP